MVEQISRVAGSNAEPARMASCRMSSLDVMKCFAAFCVVWIHFGSSWMNPVVRCAVPIFFVITGYYYPAMVGSGKFWRHFRKIVIMTLCASTLYGAMTITSHLRHDTLGEWMSSTITLRRIAGKIVLGNDMFSGHLWYFYAVLYDLIIFHFADKWKLTKWLRRAAPFLLLIFLLSNFTPWNIRLRNFLFMGLPCMMAGRLIREHGDQIFSFLAKRQYLWLYATVSLLMATGEMLLIKHIYGGSGAREMYVFTLPLILPFFYWALRNPHFGEDSVLATIGRKYSAYIYIFHYIAAKVPWYLGFRADSLLTRAIYPFIIFGVSLCMAWGFVKLLQWIKLCTMREKSADIPQ